MKAAALAGVGALVVAARAPSAEPLRLRGDALASAQSPAGLLVLDAEGEPSSWLSAEALVWVGDAAARDGDFTGDALVIAVRAHTRDDRASVRLGRFVATAGALRPTHLDGAAGRLRLPYRFDVEAFAGVPVSPAGAEGWDWIVGARASRRLGDWGSLGVATLERLDAGRLSARELGIDAGGALGKRGDAAARVAIDLLTSSLAEVAVTVGRKIGPVRIVVHADDRAPSHLIPATSLFSVLGDVPAQSGGAAVTWRAAPRLDIVGDIGARRVDRDLSPDVVIRANLRLDDRGAGLIGGELRRTGASGQGWYGARLSARVPLPHGLGVSTELELVRPDDHAHGAWWPWGLVALSARHGGWDAALAVEASASAEYTRRIDALAQLGRRWEGP